MAYTDADMVRSLLGVSEASLSDERAAVLIADAEDLIDEALGARPVDPDTGRKVVEADVETWQWAKLGRATAKLAAQIYSDPTVATGQRWRRQKGPDFEVEDPIGPGTSALGGLPVQTLLNQSGLARLTTTLSPPGGGTLRPPWYSFAFNDPDED